MVSLNEELGGGAEVLSVRAAVGVPVGVLVGAPVGAPVGEAVGTRSRISIFSKFPPDRFRA